LITPPVASPVTGAQQTTERPIGLRHVERVPEHCVWEITNACNLDCVHCESESGPPRSRELDTSEALALCDDLAALGCQVVNLSGGEPFLRPDWQQICARLGERAIEPIIVSNLTCVGPGELRALAGLGIRWVATSVDGPPAIHDRIRRTRGQPWSAFARTQATISALKERGHQVAAITHVSLWNLAHLDELAELLTALEVDLWQLQIGQPSGRLRAIAEEYLIYPGQIEEIYAFVRRVRRAGRLNLHAADDIGFFGDHELEVRTIDGEPSFFSGCEAGFRVLAIASDGTVRGCPSLEIDVGNIRETPLAEIWADERRFWWNRWDPSKLEGLCRRCAYHRLCRGGCKSLALATTGSIHRNIYCINQVKNLGGDPNRREVAGIPLPGRPGASLVPEASK
jgi:radical SAM protein with 4Fe4S-binding SPASM domain